jgi:hypothetical protein
MRPQGVEASITERGAYWHLDYLSLMTKSVTELVLRDISLLEVEVRRNFGVSTWQST